MVHLRIAMIATRIGRGLQALPGITIPFTGGVHWVSLVIVLGAGVLLLDSALLLAFSEATPTDGRRAAAALPLVALAVVPSTILPPTVPYLHGLLLFALIVAFVWGERVARSDVALVVAVCLVAGVGGLYLAPKLDVHRPWIHYRALVGGNAAHLDTFDWSQGYGPLHWPQAGRQDLEIDARRAAYWKAENLDIFDGSGWAQGTVPNVSALTGVTAGARERFTETLSVKFEAMKSRQVIAAAAYAGWMQFGKSHETSSAPAHVSPAPVSPASTTIPTPTATSPATTPAPPARRPRPCPRAPAPRLTQSVGRAPLPSPTGRAPGPLSAPASPPATRPLLTLSALIPRVETGDEEYVVKLRRHLGLP